MVKSSYQPGTVSPTEEDKALAKHTQVLEFV